MFACAPSHQPNRAVRSLLQLMQESAKVVEKRQQQQQQEKEEEQLSAENPVTR
jgi:hypothetical protein